MREGKELTAHKINIQTLVNKGNIQEMEVDHWPVLEGHEVSPYKERYCLLSDHIVNDAMSSMAIGALNKARDREKKIHDSLEEILSRYSEYSSAYESAI